MRKLLTIVVVGMFFSVTVSEAFASLTSYVVRGQVNGLGPTIQLGEFEFDVTRAASSFSETLPSGTKHVTYKFDTFDFVSPNFDFNIYNGTYGGIFIWAAGANALMQVDQYLETTGASALSVTGSATPACHGGCLTTFDFSLNYSSLGSELFSDPTQPINFGTFASATGRSIFEYTDFVPPDEGFRSVSNFNITSTAVAPVPEAEAWIFVLLGLVFLAIRLQRRSPIKCFAI